MNKIDVKKLYNRLNKRWIGQVYGYLIFILFFSLGVIVGYNTSYWLYTICFWCVILSALIVYPITFIRVIGKAEHRKEREELDKENKERDKNE